MTASQLQRRHDDSQSDSPMFAGPCRHLNTIFTTHPCIYGFVFVTVLTFDLTELVNDWLLFKDLSAIEQGLVYGPLNSLMILFLLAICIIGSMLFPFEMLNLVRDYLSGKPWVDRDLVSALIVWLQEMPMVAVNNLVSFCHDEPITYFQLTKMLLVCASVILRIVIPLLCTYINKKRYSGNERFRNSIYRLVTTAGLCLLLCGTISFFLFSHIVGSAETRVNVRQPHEIWQGQSVYQKHFTDVGIYFHHNKFKDYKEDSEPNWIKLTDIMEVYDSRSVFVKLFLHEQNHIVESIVLKSFNLTQTLSSKCYSLSSLENIDGLSIYNKTSCHSISQTFTEQLTFKFVFIYARANLILGDINFNAAHMHKGTCNNLTTSETETELVITDDNDIETTVGELLYLKHNREEEDSGDRADLNYHVNEGPRDLGDTDETLQGAEVFWRTGLFECDCTGKKGPSLEPSMKIACLV